MHLHTHVWRYQEAQAADELDNAMTQLSNIWDYIGVEMNVQGKPEQTLLSDTTNKTGIG